MGLNRAEHQLIKSGSKSWKCERCKLKDPPPSLVETAADVIDVYATWGDFKGAELVNVVNYVYLETVRWRRNFFMVPTGVIGLKFIDETMRAPS